MRRRRALIVATGFVVLATWQAHAQFRDPSPLQAPAEPRRADEVEWFPPAAQILPRWSFDVGPRTRWVAIADDGESFYWVEPDKKEGMTSGRLHCVRRGGAKASSPPFPMTFECEGGDASGGVVAIGVRGATNEWGLLVFDASDFRRIAEVPIGPRGHTNDILFVHVISPVRMLVGYQRALGAYGKPPRKACLVDLSAAQPIVTDLPDPPGQDGDTISRYLYLAVSADGRRAAIASTTFPDTGSVLQIWNVAPPKVLTTVKGKKDDRDDNSIAPTFTPDGGGVFFGKHIHHVGESGDVRSDPLNYGGEMMQTSRFLVPYGVVAFTGRPGGFIVESLFVPHRAPVKLYGVGGRAKEMAAWAALSHDGRHLAVIAWRYDPAAERCRVDVWRVEDFIARSKAAKLH